jgi:hypothetical protein
LVGIGGPAGSGKTTLANAVAHYHNAAIVSFADPMKRLLARVFEWPADLLWGPSAAKDKPIPMTVKELEAAHDRFIDCRDVWIGELAAGVESRVLGVLQDWWNHVGGYATPSCYPPAPPCTPSGPTTSAAASAPTSGSTRR